MAKWFVKKCNIDIDRICNDMQIHKPLALALNARNIRTRVEAEDILVNKENFEDIKHLRDVVKSFEIINESIEKQLPICIYGDYDADGVTSTTIVYKCLMDLGADVEYYIPDRVEDGYGLSVYAVERLAAKGIKLLITCDNGIAAIEEVKRAKELGMTVVIYDHHEPRYNEVNGERIEEIPCADAVVDAKLSNCGYGFRYMCAGALCYRLMDGLYKYNNKELKMHDELLVFAGIATICDVVELVGENRQIASMALKLLNKRVDNLGLQALIEANGLQEIAEYHIGFVIGPCINATGRLERADIAVRLFTTEDTYEAEELAVHTTAINSERKRITEEGVNRVIEQIEASSLKDDMILVVYDDEIHESIAGIIAGRLKERYNRPAIVLTRSEKGVKGSARSIECYNIFEGLHSCGELLENYGGHSMAAGLSLQKENIDALRDRLNSQCLLNEDALVPELTADGVLDVSDINIYAANELEYLRPFGASNPKPMFAFSGVYASGIRFVGSEKRVCVMTLENNLGDRVDAVSFDGYERLMAMINDEGYTEDNAYKAVICIDAMVRVDIDTYRGNRKVKLKISDFRKSLKK
jgi:single-stranded-DNA-specific exonuclease